MTLGTLGKCTEPQTNSSLQGICQSIPLGPGDAGRTGAGGWDPLNLCWTGEMHRNPPTPTPPLWLLFGRGDGPSCWELYISLQGLWRKKLHFLVYYHCTLQKPSRSELKKKEAAPCLASHSLWLNPLHATWRREKEGTFSIRVRDDRVSTNKSYKRARRMCKCRSGIRKHSSTKWLFQVAMDLPTSPRVCVALLPKNLLRLWW